MVEHVTYRLLCHQLMYFVCLGPGGFVIGDICRLFFNCPTRGIQRKEPIYVVVGIASGQISLQYYISISMLKYRMYTGNHKYLRFGIDEPQDPLVGLGLHSS